MRHLTATALLLSLSATLPAATLPPSLPDAPTPQQTTATTAQPPQNPRWHEVELLNTDEPIAILEHGRRLPTPCRLDHVDDTLIACNLYTSSMAPRRVTYPIASVEAIYLEEEAYGPTKTAVGIAAAVGGAVGGVVCHQCDANVILICIAIGAGLGLSFALTPSPSFYPPRPHLHRRLIYRAPASPTH